MSGLQAGSRRGPDAPWVGDTVTVSYALKNTTNQNLQLEYTFVGVRDPADQDRDTENMNEGRILAPGETINAQRRTGTGNQGRTSLSRGGSHLGPAGRPDQLV